MDIKLRARLSAYSKVDAIHSAHEYVSKDQIDTLFTDLDEPRSVTKDEIDLLFKETDSPVAVTKSDIDSLFTETEAPESITKNQIDSLFDEDNTVIRTVSFKEIDSLFK